MLTNNMIDIIIIVVLIFFLIYMFYEAISLYKYNTDEHFTHKTNNITPRLIAHGGGKIGLYDITNSFEAINNSINNNFKFIEVDVVKLKDSYGIAHNGLERAYYNLEQPFYETTLKEFSNSKIFKKYRPMTFDMLQEIIQENKNITFIFDTKFYTVDEFETFLDFLKSNYDNIVPNIVFQIYNLEDGILLLNRDIKNCIFALWKYNADMDNDTIFETVNKLRKKNMKIICVSIDYNKLNPDKKLIKNLRKYNIDIFLHNLDNNNEKLKKLLRNKYGLFTDEYIYIN